MPPMSPSPDDRPAGPLTGWRPWLGAPARWLGRTGWGVLKLLAWGMVVLGIAVAVAWAVLLIQILPRVDEWRTDLTQQASKALGVPVKVAQVVGRADGIWPTLSLREVQLLDARGQVALRLPEVEARLSLTTLSPQALLDGELRLDRLVLVAPELDVRRDRSGAIHVAGLKLPDAAESRGSGGGADWVMSQSRIQIRNGTVRWSDEYLGAPTLALQQVELNLSNRPSLRGRVHELTLSATPPAAFGQRFVVEASMTQPLWLVGQGGEPAARQPVFASWVPRFDVDATRPADWQSWSGTAQARFAMVDVQRLRQHVRLPIEVSGGRGAVTASLTLRTGRVQGVSLLADVRDVQVRLASGLQPLAFRRVQGEVTASNDARTASLAYRQLAFTLTDGVQWPVSAGSLSWRHAPWPAGWPASGWSDNLGGEVLADRLDLALLANLADRLPLSGQTRSHLADLAPRGVVEDLAWRWDGPATAPSTYRLSARIKALSLADSAEQGRPGLSGADAVVNATEAGGRAELKLTNGWLALPGVFEEARIGLDSLSAEVRWQIRAGAKAGDPSRWQVDVKPARFANPQVAGELEATWRTGEGADARLPGVLALKGSLQRVDATAVWRYLPLTIGASARDYVRQALRGGRGEDVRFSVDGRLADFPFKDDQGGRFRVKVPLQDVALDYAPAAITGEPEGRLWSPFTSLQGELLFEGQRMLIRQGRARLGDVGGGAFALSNVEGRIDDLAADDPVLQIGGQGEGPLQDALVFLSHSPLSAQLGSVLTQAQGQGRSTLQIALEIPLNRSIDTRLRGEVVLKEKDRAGIRLGGNIPLMSMVRGRIAFTESQLNVSARARVWGQEMVIEGQRSTEGVMRFTAQGAITAEALRQAEEYPLVARLAPRLSGETPVSVSVTMGARATPDGPPARPEVQVTSTLRGVASTLPAPLGKPAQANWPLKVTYRVEDDQAHSDAIIVDLGNPQTAQITSSTMPWLRVDLRRDTRQEPTRVTRGQIHLVQPGLGGAVNLAPMPAKGVSAQVVAGPLDVRAWKQVLDSVIDPAGGRGPRSTLSVAEQAAHQTAQQAAQQAADESFIPDTITVQSSALSWQQRTLKNVSLNVAHPSPGVWRATVDAPQVAGQVEWLPDKAPVAGGPQSSRVVARLSRLQVPPAEAEALQDQAAARMLSSEPSSSLPALDIVIDQFEWRGLDLGRFEVEAINRLVPVVGGAPLPEWRLTRMRLGNADAQLDATGNWTALGAQNATRRASGAKLLPRSAFSFTLDLQNSGALLTRLGLPQAVRGGKGKLTGQVSWLGSPLEPDPTSMSGDVKVAISEGQFLKVDAGMARLLGVLSLQALPRRFLLDFRDIFQQGFAFDGIDGDVKVVQGVATTRNLRMRGVQAIVLMEGQADLSKETQNLHVFVIPEINAGTASLAYAAINPVVGLGTFLAQMLLRKQVSEAATREFWVTGTWADPQVEKTAPRAPTDVGASADTVPEPAVSRTIRPVDSHPDPRRTP